MLFKSISQLCFQLNYFCGNLPARGLRRLARKTYPVHSDTNNFLPEKAAFKVLPNETKFERPKFDNRKEFKENDESNEQNIDKFYKKNKKEKRKKVPFFFKKPVNEAEGITVENQFEKLKNVVTPLWRTPYNQQLDIKYKSCKKFLKALSQDFKKSEVNITLDHSGIPCHLEFTKPSPAVKQYRNKDEFGIRHGVDGKTKTVGFYIGSPAEDGRVVCVEPDGLDNTKPDHLQIAKIFQDYIRSSQYEVCYGSNQGHWRNLIVRSNVSGDLMVIVIMHPQNLTTNELDVEKTKLINHFMSKSSKIKSLYFQACPHTRCSHIQAPFQLLAGEPNIIEEVCDVKIRISPESFLQINTYASEVLYDTVRNFAQIGPETTVLDICSGAGSISLVLANSACRTIGIELTTQGVEDSKYNAALNGINNASYYRGFAEKLLPELVNDLFCTDLVVILNPGRGGLKPSVMRAIREHKSIRRVVYISCKPEGVARENFLQLCKPCSSDVRLGAPFLPVIAVPVDMFPQTYHTELVLVFERV